MKRIATILAPEDIGASGTKIIDLNIRDQISRIVMRWRCTNVTVSVMLDAILACISKVELVDGSEVLYSLSGQECQALNYHDRKIMPYNSGSLTVGGYFESQFAIDFGRFLYDPMFAFVPLKYKNPQLKITWNEATCNTSVVVNEFSIYAYVDEAPPVVPQGFLMAQVIKESAMAASSHLYPDLPTDNKIRRVMLRGLSTDHDPILLFDNIKLSLDNGKFVPIDMKAADLDKILSLEYPLVTENWTLDAAVTAKDIYSNLSKDLKIAIDYDDTAVTAAGEFTVPTITGAKIALVASVIILGLTAVVVGRHPHNCFVLDFGNPADPESWLDVRQFASAEMDLLMSSDADSGDTTRVIVQSVKE